MVTFNGDTDMPATKRALTPDERIAKLRKIVTECQHAKIEGTTVDLFSASAIVKVYDAINAEQKAAYSKLPVAKMAAIAFKMMK